MLLKQAIRSILKYIHVLFEIWLQLVTDSERFTRLHTIVLVISASEVNQWNDRPIHSQITSDAHRLLLKHSSIRDSSRRSHRRIIWLQVRGEDEVRGRAIALGGTHRLQQNSIMRDKPQRCWDDKDPAAVMCVRP